jgi:uncharacterized protein (TIGR03067 family)
MDSRLRIGGWVRPCLILVVTAGLALAAAPLTPGGVPDQKRIAQLIKQLGDDDFAKREAASKALEAIGAPALAALRKAATTSSDLEVRRRAERITRSVKGRLLAVAAGKEIERLRGTWYSTSTESNGVRQTGENKADKHVFTGDQWVMKVGERVVQAGTIRVIEVGDDLVKVDFVTTQGVAKGAVWLGVYQCKGDELKWCGVYVSQGKERPTGLATKAGDGYFLRSLKREKK